MSFAADLKDFASNFRDTYKAFKTDWKDELYREEAEGLRGARIAGDTAAATATPRGTSPRPSTGRTSGVSLTAADIPKVIAAEGGDPYDVAEVIRNRAEAAKVDPVKVVAYEGAFEPVSRGSWQDQPQDRVEAARQAWEEVLRTKRNALKGATHFYDADTQAKLGRKPPAWDDGSPVATARGGARRFFRRPGDRFALSLDDETVPVVYAARGGVIPTDLADTEHAGSNPAVAAAYENTDPDDGYDPRDLVNVEGARRAVAGGLKFGQRMLGAETHHAAVPEAARINPDGVRALATNAGAPRREEIAMVDQTIDPKGQLPPELREVARYNAIYQYWSARGEPQKADRAAWSMLSAAKRAASQYGAAALAVDDPVKRAEIIAKGYNQLVPDGNTLEIKGKSGDGVKFELHDAQGRVTEKGALAIDDMVQMATGMVNGTEYLRSMVQFATSQPTAAERKAEKARSSVEAYQSTLSEDDRSDFMASRPSDESRKKFLDMPTEEQNRTVREWQRDRKQAFDEFKFDERMKKGAENLDRKEALDIAKFATRYGMWEKTREGVMTMHEQKLAQLQAQEEGRNKRFDQSQDARRKRQQEIDQRILDKRTATKDGAGVKLTAKEAAESRRLGAVDTAEQAGIEAVETTTPLPRGVSEGTAAEVRRRAVETEVGPVQAQAALQRMPAKEREVDETDFKEIRDKLPTVWKEGTSTDHLWASQIAAEIRATSGNRLTNDDAINITREALSGNSKPRVLPDGSLQVGNLPPVLLSRQNLIALAQMRERITESERQKRWGPNYRVQPATPGATAPTGARRNRALNLPPSLLPEAP
jgi:hypothetical protein